MRLDEIDRSYGPVQLRALTDTLWARQQPYIGKYRLSVVKMIKQQVRRLERMQDSLYDDRLSSLISEQKYAQKADVLRNDLEYLGERLERLEQVESQTPAANARPTSLLVLYSGESKIGKRIIMQKLFTVTMQAGRAQFVPIKN